MPLRTMISFHGVSGVKIGEVTELPVAGTGKTWLSTTVYLYDANGEQMDTFQVHANPGEPLNIGFEVPEDTEKALRKEIDWLRGALGEARLAEGDIPCSCGYVGCSYANGPYLGWEEDR